MVFRGAGSRATMGSGARDVPVPSEGAGNSYVSLSEEWDPPEVVTQH